MPRLLLSLPVPEPVPVPVPAPVPVPLAPTPTPTPEQVLRLLLGHAKSTRLARCWRWLLGCCCRHASLLAFVAAVPAFLPALLPSRP